MPDAAGDARGWRDPDAGAGGPDGPEVRGRVRSEGSGAFAAEGVAGDRESAGPRERWRDGPVGPGAGCVDGEGRRPEVWVVAGGVGAGPGGDGVIWVRVGLLVASAVSAAAAAVY